MFRTRITSRIVAAVLAVALALAGLGIVDIADQQDAPTEHAGATWSVTLQPGGQGGAGTQGATWS